MNQHAPQEFHLTISTAGVNAPDMLSERSGLTKQKIKQAMQKGAVWLERGNHVQRLRRAKKALQTGDQLHCYYDEAVLSEEPVPAQLVADETAYSVWNKPHGMLSQGSKWGDHCAIYRWVEVNLKPQRPAFIVHRLDRAARGLILIAHSKTAAAKLAQLFEQRAIEKVYRVSVAGCFSTVPLPHIVNTELDGRSACTHIEQAVYQPARGCSLLDVRIETGRKHQIRRHLAGLGYPVLGDRLYGAGESEVALQLVARYLAFRCPFSGEGKQYQLLEPLSAKE